MTIVMNRLVNQVTVFRVACGILGAIIRTIPQEKLELFFNSKSHRLHVTQQVFMMQLC